MWLTSIDWTKNNLAKAFCYWIWIFVLLFSNSTVDCSFTNWFGRFLDKNIKRKYFLRNNMSLSHYKNPVRVGGVVKKSEDNMKGFLECMYDMYGRIYDWFFINEHQYLCLSLQMFCTFTFNLLVYVSFLDYYKIPVFETSTCRTLFSKCTTLAILKEIRKRKNKNTADTEATYI